MLHVVTSVCSVLVVVGLYMFRLVFFVVLMSMSMSLSHTYKNFLDGCLKEADFDGIREARVPNRI